MQPAESNGSMGVAAGRLRVTSPGHAFFAATMIAAGVVGLVQRDFTPTWSGVPEHSPLGPALVYFTAAVSVGCGFGLLWRRFASVAAGVLLGVFMIWVAVFRISPILVAPGVTDGWWALGDSVLMVAASWVLLTWFAGDRSGRLVFVTDARGIRIARRLFGLALIPFGVAHFTYLERTVSLVPGWLPWHLAWAYATGCAFIAAGVGLLVGVWSRLAATLVTLQLGLFTVLVWVPVVVTGPDPSQWAEFVSSWVLTAAAWVVADSFRGTPWLGVGQG